jgi:hypothetical protein
MDSLTFYSVRIIASIFPRCQVAVYSVWSAMRPELARFCPRIVSRRRTLNKLESKAQNSARRGASLLVNYLILKLFLTARRKRKIRIALQML